MDMDSNFEYLSNMNKSEYKKYHETFMTNNQGSTVLHTCLCIFFTVQCSLFCSISDQWSGLRRYIYEYILIVLPMIIAHTVLPDYIYLLNIAIFTLLFYEFMYQYHNLDITKKFTQLNTFKTGRIQTVSAVRGLTYLITVLCILAVDFQSFPRNLAKTENYGYSLMDTGVGLFVLISGLVHKNVHKGNVLAILKSNAKFVSILLFLGVARFLTVNQLDYHQHVTEYGVHWNFFFTIAVCKLLSSLFLYFSSHALTLSIITLILHEFMLYAGLETWVFSNTPRTNMLNANREGLSSSLGYVSMYLYMANVRNILNDKTVPRYKTLTKITLTVTILWFLTYLVPIYRPSSRTLANASYCLYVEAILSSIILVLYINEVLFDNFNVPVILSSVNANGLTCFLFANLMTGAINLSIRTLLVPSYATFLILNIYMILAISFTVFLRSKGIRL